MAVCAPVICMTCHKTGGFSLPQGARERSICEMREKIASTPGRCGAARPGGGLIADRWAKLERWRGQSNVWMPGAKVNQCRDAITHAKGDSIRLFADNRVASVHLIDQILASSCGRSEEASILDS